MLLAVNETFIAPQGEGLSMGVPSFFLRLNGCNLDCHFCDTPFTWRKDVLEKSTKVTVEQVHRQVLESGVRNVVITGGEPMLQRNSVFELACLLRKSSITVEIETNGTIPIADDLNVNSDILNTLRDCVTQWNVSPKLSHARVSKQRDLKDLLALWKLPIAWDFGWVTLKFVVRAGSKETLEKDFTEVEAAVSSLQNPVVVVLMPEGVTADSQMVGMKTLTEAAARLGSAYGRWRMMPRLHVLTHGDERKR